MSEHVDKIVKDAAGNVACETKEEVSKETLENIKQQILGQSKKSDESFIEWIYKFVVKNKEEMKEEGKKYGRK